MDIEGETYTSTVDLVVSVHGKRYMAIKCAPGSLASREREILSAARLLDDHQIPLAVASDGSTSLVWDTISGNSLGQGLDAVPSKIMGLFLTVTGNVRRLLLGGVLRSSGITLKRIFDTTHNSF